MRLVEKTKVVTDGNAFTGAVKSEWGGIWSADGQYRYRLWRELPFFDRSGSIAFVMLNPSTADENENDPTVQRCYIRTSLLGYRRIDVVNIFALVSTDPKALYKHPDPIGPENDRAIESACARADMRIVAWGNHGRHKDREEYVLRLIRKYGPIHCLGMTKTGFPRHPLYVPYNQNFVEFEDALS